MRHSIILLSVSLFACNAGPTESCVAPGQSLASAGTPGSSCSGECTTLAIPDAGDASIPFCAIDCTTGGQASCENARTCASLRSLGLADSGTSYCIYECATEDGGNDAGTCPSGFSCYAPVGVCF